LSFFPFLYFLVFLLFFISFLFFFTVVVVVGDGLKLSGVGRRECDVGGGGGGDGDGDGGVGEGVRDEATMRGGVKTGSVGEERN
jgi:hypothetical protein